MTIRCLGWHPDPPHASLRATARRFQPTSSVLPDKASLANLVVDVRDQMQIGSCVAVSAVQAIRMRDIAQGADPKTVGIGSALYGYFYARAIDGTTARDSGTSHSSFFKGVSEYGLPPESAWPYSDTNTGHGSDPFRRPPSAEAIRLAFDQRAPFDVQVIDHVDPRTRLDLVRGAIAENRPVLLGVGVDLAFEQEAFDPTKPLDPPKSPNGGHAMVVEGYEVVDGALRFTILNSWGSSFGVDGRCLFSANYLAMADLCIVERAAQIPGGAS